MPKTLLNPAMPMGVSFDPEDTLLNNASAAREADKAIRRRTAERGARRLARAVFRTEEFEFAYDVRLGLDSPSFEVEGELILFNGEDFSLIEFCSDCGKEPKGRRFGSLAQLGRALEERDEDEAHLCRICTFMGQSKRK